MLGSNMRFNGFVSRYTSRDAHEISPYDEKFVVAKINMLQTLVTNAIRQSEHSIICIEKLAELQLNVRENEGDQQVTIL